jgi:hypothetical protein
LWPHIAPYQFFQAALLLAQQVLHERTNTFASLQSLAGRLQALQASSAGSGGLAERPSAKVKLYLRAK